MEALTRMAQRDERGLIASAAAGDEPALQRIVAEHHDDMRRVCSYVTRDEAVAEEAAQAAWSVAWKKTGKVHGPAQLRPWLVCVCGSATGGKIRVSSLLAELLGRSDGIS